MRILVVKLSSLGDILHVLPTVCALKAQTGASIDWVVHPEFAAIVRCFAAVDNVLTFPRRKFFGEFRRSLRELRKVEYDLVIDLHGLMKSAIVTFLSRAKRKVGPSYAREGSALLYPERAGRMHRDCHAAVQAFDTLDYLGYERPQRDLNPSDFNLSAIEVPHGAPLIAFAPVSRWDSKNWPVSHFAALASLIAKARPNAKIVVVGGKADIIVGNQIVVAAPKSVVNLCGKTSIAESMALLSECDLLIANDTGPVHMAAAVGTRCLVVFGPTRPDWTGPFGNGHRTIMKSLPCQPCLRHTCPKGTKECMTAISPEEVMAQAFEMLGEGVD